MPTIRAGSAVLPLARRRRGRGRSTIYECCLCTPAVRTGPRRTSGFGAVPKTREECVDGSGGRRAGGRGRRGVAPGLLDVARREGGGGRGLEPAGPFRPLGGVGGASPQADLRLGELQHDGDASATSSNAFPIEWPPRSGKRAEFPEVDRAAWFDLPSARRHRATQRRFVDDLAVIVANTGAGWPVTGPARRVLYFVVIAAFAGCRARPAICALHPAAPAEHNDHDDHGRLPAWRCRA